MVYHKPAWGDVTGSELGMEKRRVRWIRSDRPTGRAGNSNKKELGTSLNQGTPTNVSSALSLVEGKAMHL